MAIVKKGDNAPSFELRDQNGYKISSNDIKGKILLGFHPLAFTSICTDQMRDLENNYEEFTKRGVTPFGVSVDAYPSKGVWAKSIALKKLKILADFNPKGKLANELGIYIDKAGISRRASILIENGKVLWAKQYDDGVRPDINEILAAIDNL